MKWTNLDDWHELDRRVKERVARMGSDIRFRGVAPEALNAWLTSQVTLAVAVPLLAAPLVTWVLYSWLPQPDAWLYELAGVMLLGVALAAHHEYKKLNATAPMHSDHSPAAAQITGELRGKSHEDHHPGSHE